MPVSPENPPLGRVYVGHLNVEDAAWPQPFAHFSQDPSRLVEVLEHVKTGDDIESFSRERCFRDVSHKNMGPRSGLGSSRTLGGHLDSVSLPRFPLERLEEGSRAAAEIKDSATLPVLS